MSQPNRIHNGYYLGAYKIKVPEPGETCGATGFEIKIEGDGKSCPVCGWRQDGDGPLILPHKAPSKKLTGVSSP